MKAWKEIFVQWWFWVALVLYSAYNLTGFVIKLGGIGWGSAIGTVLGSFIVITLLSTIYYFASKN